MNKEQALNIWQQLFGDSEIAYDYSSHPMKREDFNNASSHYGWDLDLIKPQVAGGRETTDNLLPCSLMTISIREGKNSFRIGKFLYEVRKGRIFGTSAIYDVTDHNNPINLSPNEENQSKIFNDNRMGINITTDPVTPTNAIDYSSIGMNNLFSRTATEALVNAVVAPADEEKTVVEESPVSISPENNSETPEKESETNPENSETEKINDDNPTEDSSLAMEEAFKVETDFANEYSSSDNETVVENNTASEDTLSEDNSVPSDTEIATEPITLAPNLTEETNKEISPVETKEETVKENPNAANESSLLEENNRLNAKIIKQEEDIQKLNDRLLELDGKVADKEINGDIPVDYERTEASDIDEISPELKALEDQVSALTLELNKTKEELNQASLANQELNTEKNRLVAEKEELIKKQNDEEKESGDLKQSLTALSAEDNTKDTAIQELKSQNQNLSNQITDLKSSNSSLTQDNSNLQKEAALKEETISKLNPLVEENNALKAKISALETENNQQQEENAKNLSAENEELTALKTKIQELNNEISTLNTEKASNESLIQKQNADIETEKQQVSTLTSQLDQLSLNQKQEEEQVSIEKESWLQEKNQYQTDAETLKTQLIEANKNKDDLEISVQNQKADLLAKDDSLNQLNSTNQQLKTSNDELLKSLEDKENQIRNKDLALSEMTKKQEEATELNNSLVIDKKHLEDLNQSLTSQLSEKDNNLKLTSSTLEKTIAENKDVLSKLNEESQSLQQQNLYLGLFGKKECYPQFEEEFSKTGMDYLPVNVKSLLLTHPEWVVDEGNEIYVSPKADDSYEEEVKPLVVEAEELSEENVSYSEDERQEAQQAKSFFKEIYHDSDIATDFAGREIHFLDYENQDSPFGWSYRLMDSQKEETADNVLVASLLSLNDFVPQGSFTTNGHTFHLNKDATHSFLVSEDYISDPYDLAEVMKKADQESARKEPLVYLFVKLLGTSGVLSDDSFNSFTGIVEKTVKRCCTSSFIDLQVNHNPGADYLFLTFDGTIDGVYKEALSYAILLNSYRKEFYNRGELNAIIVLDKTDALISQRHLTLDKLTSETKDLGLRAIRYDLNQIQVINSTIKRTIHIGPEIISELDVDQTRFVESSLGQGNFAEIFGFNGHYEECHFIYNLRKKDEDTK